ncbi:DUF6555 family protein [Pseudomonas sp. 6D_7.1_Bac1]|jgi:hypothetical protein|uniref:DUF6555 family protein n=1 Tax=Pseudomonas sp. 6D_7.1_Bac1 TaxID=2971615 RepID=UPI0021C8EDA8|nr:DUF6555 family protein [Pseudomonas sp. 6D_7.1_Bac1]MCU1751969.1 hypothetical protein [Pseudomonas sp. 6D_7.1_Bac1]
MTIQIPFSIHYLFEGENRHFYILASNLSDCEAIRLAAQHATESLLDRIAPDTPRDVAQLKAEFMGITKVRWNEAV